MCVEGVGHHVRPEPAERDLVLDARAGNAELDDRLALRPDRLSQPAPAVVVDRAAARVWRAQWHLAALRGRHELMIAAGHQERGVGHGIAERDEIRNAPGRAVGVRRFAVHRVGADPQRLARALEPKLERAISLTIADFIEHVPTGYIKPVEILDSSARVSLKASEIEKGMPEKNPKIS